MEAYSERAVRMSSNAVGKMFSIRTDSADVVEGKILDCEPCGKSRRGKTIYTLFKVKMLVEYKNTETGKVFPLEREYKTIELPR